MSKNRILSLVLALVMVLGTVGSVFAAETAVEKAEFLASKGILVGDNAGNLMLDHDLIRSHSAVLLSRLYGNKDADMVDTDMPFTDVTDVTAPFVAWAHKEGLVAGTSATTFTPGGPLTAQQFASLLLRALGYEATVEAYNNAFESAKEVGILEDVKVEKDSQLNRAEMAEMTFNALNAKLADGSKTLAEKLGIVMPGTPAATLKVNKVYTENLAEIVVELSNVDLVRNKTALTNPANYRLSDVNIKVENVRLDGNNVVLTLIPYGEVKDLEINPNVLVKGKDYNLTIRNVDQKINITSPSFKAIDNTIPSVEKVEFIGTHGIKVTTSEPVARVAERNFTLNTRMAMKVEQYGREIILTSYYGQEFDKEEVKLVVDQLEDFAGYKSIKTDHDLVVSNDEGLPQVKESYRVGKDLIVVFDRDVYLDSVKAYKSKRELGNASYEELRNVVYAKDAEKVDTNVVRYTFEREIPRGVEFRIEGVKNHFNKAMDVARITPDVYRDEFAPSIIEKSPVKLQANKDTDKLVDDSNRDVYQDNLNKGEVKVTTESLSLIFDKDIKEFEGLVGKELDSKTVKNHFKLYELDLSRRGELAAEGIEITAKVASKDKIELTFKDIKVNNKNRDYDYVLEVMDFRDLNGNKMDRDYVDFEVIRRSAGFNVEIKNIKETRYFNRDGVEVRLEFNDAVNKVEASNAKNYFVDGKIKVDEAIVERDGKTVSLVFYDVKDVKTFKEKNEILEISPAVTNLKGAKVKDRFFNLVTEKVHKSEVIPEETVAAITYINNTTGKKVEGTVVLDKAVASTKINVKYVGDSTVTQAVLYDKDGLVVETNGTKALTAGYDFDIKTEYASKSPLKIEVKDGSKVISTLVIELKGNDTDVDVTSELVKGENKDIVEGTTTTLVTNKKLTELTFAKNEKDEVEDADILIKTNDAKATFEAELVGKTLTVKVVSEDGKENFTYSYLLKIISEEEAAAITIIYTSDVRDGKTFAAYNAGYGGELGTTYANFIDVPFNIDKNAKDIKVTAKAGAEEIELIPMTGAEGMEAGDKVYHVAYTFNAYEDKTEELDAFFKALKTSGGEVTITVTDFADVVQEVKSTIVNYPGQDVVANGE